MLGELGTMWPKVPVCGTLVVRSLVPILGEREDGHQVMGCIPIATIRWSQVTWALEVDAPALLSRKNGLFASCAGPLKAVGCV